MRRLAILDIDGTLTLAVDKACLVRAFDGAEVPAAPAAERSS